MQDKIQRLIDDFIPYYAKVILLVGSGLKAGSYTRYSDPSKADKWYETLFDWNINCYVSKLKCGLNQILFWKGVPRVEPSVAASALGTEDHATFGLFMGYPDCCAQGFVPRFSGGKYLKQLRAVYKSRGLPGIEHLIGLSHIPCDINCKGTRNLGYGRFLKKNAPPIYQDCLNTLIRLATS